MEINENKLKEILEKQKEDYKRYLKILHEDFGSQGKLIAEKYASIKETLDTHTDQIASIKETVENHTDQIASIKETLDTHTDQIASIKETVENHTQLAVSTKEDIEIIKVDTELIKTSIKKKVDIEEFSALAKRVAILESRIRIR